MELLRDFQRAWVCIPASCEGSKNFLITNISISGAQIRGTPPPHTKSLSLNIEIVPGIDLNLKGDCIWTKQDNFGLTFKNLSKKESFILRALVWAHRKEDLEEPTKT